MNSGGRGAGGLLCGLLCPPLEIDDMAMARQGVRLSWGMGIARGILAIDAPRLLPRR